MLVKEITVNERPREKALKYGIATLSNRELLALLLRSGNSGFSVFDIADELINVHGSLAKLGHLDITELMKHKGIKVAKALELQACMELTTRMLAEELADIDVINSPQQLVSWLRLKFGWETQEQFIVVFLNVKNAIAHYEVVAKGGLDSTFVHPREVFKQAIKLSCAKIICVHNHPSGDVQASKADIDVTKALLQAAKLLRIELLDHLIISDRAYFSFKDNGLLNF